MQKTEEKKSVFRRLLFSGATAGKDKSTTLAYIAVVTALSVVTNMFFEIKFADIQFSLTICVSALAGILLGGAFGFIACFLGDLVGFLYNSGGYMYMPWIGLSMGCVALLSGFLIGGVKLPIKGGLFIKLGILSVTTFLLCTIAINTTAFWLMYAKGVPYFTYLIARVFVGGQIWNSLVNYVLLFIIVPTLKKVKALRLNIR